MIFHKGSRAGQQGSVMLEALIAIVIFSFGILGLIGLQMMAVKQSADAQFRSTASMLVNKLLGKMWVQGGALANIQTVYNNCPNGCDGWVDDVKAALPVTGAHAPEVTVGADGKVTVKIYWNPTTEQVNDSEGLFKAALDSTSGSHSYTVIAYVAKNLP